jgi:3-oxoacyl-(acyl-carrier-protein) synthase
MKTYIRAASAVSPQQSFEPELFYKGPVAYAGDRLTCIEPDYDKIIDARMIRRMSRIIRMGTAAAMQCLKELNQSGPDAITTGTAYGCMEDTGIFLKKMVENREELLTPTSFIQSTHNTVAGQIALMLKCHRYNNTFVHRGFSFESALLDAILLLKEKEMHYVLAGAADEITNTSHAILSRFGLYRSGIASNLELYKSSGRGTLNGEGAAFFLLSNTGPEEGLVLEGIRTFYNPASTGETSRYLQGFLSEHAVEPAQLDLMIDGRSGDPEGDLIYHAIQNEAFKGTPSVPYKYLCGEYPTSAAFALWLAFTLLHKEQIPAWMKTDKRSEPIRRILIYTHYQQLYHTAILIKRC